MAQVELPGGIVYLSCDPERVRAKMAGETVTLQQALPLRDDVSTDEMTSQRVCSMFEDGFGGGLLSDFLAEGEYPIPLHGFENIACSVIVAGKRYGKGSSREHSPLAHKSVGIRLIIADSFERIFRQNCDSLGIFTSSDFGLIARIEAGEPILIDELVSDRDPLAANLLRAGGLMAYGRALDLSAVPVTPTKEPQTLTEKILARHAVAGMSLTPGVGSFVRADWRFSHEYYTGMITTIMEDSFGDPAPIHDPATMLLFEDHLTFAHRSRTHIDMGLLPGVASMSRRHRAFGEKYGLVNHGASGDEGSEGICHALMIEKYALPGQIVVGTDSHTTHSGALGCLAFGAGSTDIALSFATGAIRLPIPESILIYLEGRLPAGVMAKDVVLHLAATPALKAGSGLAKVFEFAGPAVEAMSMDERATLTNMVAELGGFTGIVAPDAETERFLREVRGVEVRAQDWMRSDPGAHYAEDIRLDVSGLMPFVAKPGDPGNAMPLADVGQEVAIDIAYAGSCTAGKREDFDQYHAVLSWAAERGLRVAPGVQLFLQFGTLAVKDYCEERGYLDAFRAVGAEMLMPSCGACAGCGPGSSTHADQVTVSSINRNFPGRSGPGQVWLASPPTVVASAIAGRIVSFETLQEQERAPA